MTNGVLIHKMRAGDTSLTEAVITQPRPLKSRTFKKLTKFGLNESDVIGTADEGIDHPLCTN